MEKFIPIFFNSLTLISILMLVGLGMVIIFGLMGVINLAHGEFVTIGAYTAAFVQISGGNFWMALIIAPLVGGIIGFLIERFLIRYIYTQPVSAILATWGLSLAMQQIIQLSFGAAPQPVDSPLVGTLFFLNAEYPAYRLFLIVFGLAVMGGCLALFRWSSFGLDLRTAIQDRDMAEALGIDTNRLFGLAFALGAAIAAVAGVLIAPLTVVIAQMGANYLARSFFVVIVGGVGSIPGLIAGSALVGGVETILNYQIPVTVSQALVLVLAIVIIRFRPQGLIPV